MFPIREGRPDDAGTIARLITQRFGDAVSVERVRRALPGHITQVAETSGGVVGFVDGFMTETIDGLTRFELDLIAVDKMAAGQGIGQALIQAITGEAMSRDVNMIRALVAVDNLPMEAALTRCGYRVQWDVCGLFISHSQNAGLSPDSSLPDDTHLITVNTLIYSGIWLEGKLSRTAIESARALQLTHGLDITGTVRPLRAASDCELLQDAGFTGAGEYHWWQLT